jgi:phosphoribosylglycinamide formyltransferase-1
MKNVAILLSGRGSNFLALSDAIEAGQIPAEIVLVVSNLADATGLDHARKRNYPAVCIPSAGIEREAYDRQVVRELQAADTEIVCLAGFMRLLSPWFVRQYPHHILNIHPSLLPSFPGLHGQRQALEWGARLTGCTVHLVDEELDHGPIILQQAVPVLDDDSEDSLSQRILEYEHRIYPQALKLVCEDRIRVEGRRIVVSDSEETDSES